MTEVGDLLGERIEVVALLPCFFLDCSFVKEVFFDDLFETELSFCSPSSPPALSSGD